MTYADLVNGTGRNYVLAFTAVQDPAAGTLWDKVWTAAGTTVAVLLKPLGNPSPTVAAPHFAGDVTITKPVGDLIGGEADASTTARFTFEGEWFFTAKPTRITA